ncbi:hypothetical protein J2046_002336 [Rhizobium petrolearium]|uniref:DUF3551 domain-containing protein n=2 Tax=Neorhizobium TaxID=1525371 RepID=A0ABV0M8P5_9HYPH|nr:hypothetical protein [Neorhizobium petrolearium]MBP1844078.1 hypothetical protein [Neorhizobium petrolearium]MCC2613468.1 hypothetical protein [Neorhizobium petrolearium]WGI71793.1 hypothetical protein QEO92_26955 [Neorhizobium petrolearium]
MQSRSDMRHRRIPGLIALLLVLATAEPFTTPAAAQEPDDEPFEEFCLAPGGSARQACVAFFLDEDGYELCLMDEREGIARCTRSWHIEPDEKRDRGSLPLGFEGPGPGEAIEA